MMARAPAAPEYATAKIAVWWDMNDCPVPDGYDARRVRPSIVAAFTKLGYSGPVSITAFADQTQTSGHLLRGLSSTGVAVAHTMTKGICSVMYSDMLKWRSHNPPPATMMLISNQVEDVFSWDLVRLQQETKYNMFLAYSYSSDLLPILDVSAEWRWEKLLGLKMPPGEIQEEINLSAMFYCKSCKFDVQSLEKFRKHLSSKRHALKEVRNPPRQELDPITRLWGKNYMAKPEYATAKIMVWWDMYECPIPEGYDARMVRPSLVAAFKQLGYSGPVSITAFADQTKTPDHILGGLSSTGVAVAHTLVAVRFKRMFSDLCEWQDLNPPPATMMLISNQVEHAFSNPVAKLQQEKKYNLFLAYSFRPYKMSILVTSAEWLWESLLAETTSHFLHKCSSESGESTLLAEPKRHVLHKCSSESGESTLLAEPKRHVLHKCSSESGESTLLAEPKRHVLHKCSSESGESTGMFYCRSCYCDCKSLDHFREHLLSKDHAMEEHNIIAGYLFSEYEREYWLDREVEEKFSKSKRFRSRTGFGLLHDHLRLAKRRRA